MKYTFTEKQLEDALEVIGNYANLRDQAIEQADNSKAYEMHSMYQAAWLILDILTGKER